MGRDGVGGAINIQLNLMDCPHGCAIALMRAFFLCTQHLPTPFNSHPLLFYLSTLYSDTLNTPAPARGFRIHRAFMEQMLLFCAIIFPLSISSRQMPELIICRPFVPEINFKTQKTEILQTLRLVVFYLYQAPDDTIIRAILLFSSDFCFLKFSPLNRIGAHLSSIRS